VPPPPLPKPDVPPPLNNNLEIRNGNTPESRIKKRIGTIRKKVKNMRSMINALKKGGRRIRTRRSSIKGGTTANKKTRRSRK
jgi:hypothetical protein